ncbi:DUF2170 family protein [Escherichia coli]|uniref:DUF2170 family protein n=1 Tax=Escherichia coli TaxID=562 RepID=UPI0035A2BB73
MTSLKTSIKTITYLSDTGCLEIQGASLTFLLRNQKMMPLSSVGISSVQQEEYYIVFGALSLKSSLEDILLEITSLVDNALDLAEITEEYSH